MDTSNKDIHMNTTKMYINEFGDKIYKNSKRQYHRLDGPAVEWLNGNKWWYKEDFRHRKDGPAIECSNGDKYWYKEGKLHRLDGSAIEYSDGRKSWYILEKNLKEKEFNSWLLRIKTFI